MSTAQAQNKYWFLPDLADLIFVLVLFLVLCLRPGMIFIDGFNRLASCKWQLYFAAFANTPH